MGEATVGIIHQFRVNVAQSILAGVRRSIWVTDSMKFAHTAPIRIAHISALDVLVTDQQSPDSMARGWRKHHVEVVLADYRQ